MAGKTTNSQKFTPSQDRIIQLAKSLKKKGIPNSEVKDLLQKANDNGLRTRGPEAHPNRPYGKVPHVHVGPVNHIPIIY